MVLCAMIWCDMVLCSMAHHKAAWHGMAQWCSVGVTLCDVGVENRGIVQHGAAGHNLYGVTQAWYSTS